MPVLQGPIYASLDLVCLAEPQRFTSETLRVYGGRGSEKVHLEELLKPGPAWLASISSPSLGQSMCTPQERAVHDVMAVPHRHECGGRKGMALQGCCEAEGQELTRLRLFKASVFTERQTDKEQKRPGAQLSATYD